MGSFEAVKTFFTGKTELERKQEQIAASVIRKEAMAAQLRVRRENEIKLAEQRENLRYKDKLRRLNTPRSSFSLGSFSVDSPGYRNYGSVTGTPNNRSRFKKLRKKKIGNTFNRRVDLLGF